MIAKFFASLNDTGKKLLIVAAVIVLLALFDRLLLSPTMSKISSIDNEIKKEEIEIKQDIRFLGYKNQILQTSEAYQPYLTADNLSDDERIAAFLKKLEILAQKANVTIKTTPTGGSKQDGPYLKYQADVECNGQLKDVVTFMHSVETTTDLMRVTKYNLGGKKSDTGDDVKATMSIVKAIISSDPAAVTKAATPQAPAATTAKDSAQ